MPKISDLPADTAPDSADLIPFVDVTASRTESVTVANLAASAAFAGQYAPLAEPIAVAGLVLKAPLASPTFSGNVVIPDADAATEALNRQTADARYNRPIGVDLPATSGNYISTPDTAALDITGDLDIRCRLSMDDWTPAAQSSIVGKYTTTGNQRSWWFNVTTTGALSLNWSATGAMEATTGVSAPTSTVSTGFANGSTHWVRVTFDANNGAGGNTTKFYTSDDGVAWTQLGADFVAAGVAAFYSSTAPLELGSVTGGTLGLTAGVFYRAQVRSGIDGTIVADWTAGLPFQPYGLTWTVSGSAWAWFNTGDAVRTEDYNSGYSILRYGAVTGGVTDCAAAFTAACSAASAGGGGNVIIPPGTFAIASLVTVPAKVNLVGAGNAGTSTIKCTAAGAGISFGAVGTDSFGGASSGFTVDGNNIATHPFSLGRTVQRTFTAIDINNAATAALLIEEAQNNTFMSCNIGSSAAGVVIDRGAGGNAFFRFEVNDCDGPYVESRQTVASPAVYVEPRHNGFYHSIFERPAANCDELIWVRSGVGLYFNQCVLQGGPARPFALVRLVEDSAVSPVCALTRFSGCIFQGDAAATDVVGIAMGASTTAVIDSVCYFENMADKITVPDNTPRLWAGPSFDNNVTVATLPASPVTIPL